MRKFMLAIIFLAICPLPVAQQVLNNDGVIKLIKAGIPDDLIVSTINAQPGNYDTSADGLNAMKAAGASGKVIVAMVMKSAGPARIAPAAAPRLPPPPAPVAIPVAPPVICEPKPAMQLSLCAFDVDGAGMTESSSSMGLAPMMIAHSHNRPYFEHISKEVQHFYEREIEKSCRFQVVKNEKPGDSATQNPPPICVNAKPFWGTSGRHFDPAVFTKWEVDGPGGCKLKFKTSAISTDKSKLGATGANPSSKPVYLNLSKEDANQFLDTIQKEMEKAGCKLPAPNP